MNNLKLHTSGDITLIASTLEHVRTELEAPEQLSDLLDATVPTDWPPGEYDRDAMEFFRTRFEEGGAAVEGWYGWYAIRDQDFETPRMLIGSAGYFGPPSDEGIVEIGYSVLPAWQRRGYASEVVRALVDNAFSKTSIGKVIAHTTKENLASIAVLLRCGFVEAGPGQDPTTLRFERHRSGT